jgi:hypothetical protein
MLPFIVPWKAFGSAHKAAVRTTSIVLEPLPALISAELSTILQLIARANALCEVTSSVGSACRVHLISLVLP